MTQPALALTVLQIKNRVKRTFGDTANVQVLDSDIIDWINASMRDLIQLNQLGRVKATTASVAKQSDYTLPVGITGLLGVKYKGEKLQFLSTAEADQVILDRDDPTSYPSGTPYYYWVYNDTLTLYPAPDTSNATYITLYYTIFPGIVAADSDVPGVPAEYHNRIIDYCLAQAYELNGDLQAAQIKMSQFTNDRRELSGQSDTETQTGPYPSITDTDNDAAYYA